MFELIKRLIEEQGVEFLINCCESRIDADKDSINFHNYVTGDDTTIRPETPITFDAGRNEFIWLEDYGDDEIMEFRAKPYLELTKDLAEAIAMIDFEITRTELNKLDCADAEHE